jgi:RimJ/RimL family protein N-acetyltransferase
MMSPAAPVTYRRATADDIPRLEPLVVPDPVSRLEAVVFRRSLAMGEYRPEWMWLAETGPGPGGIAVAAIWWGNGDTAPVQPDEPNRPDGPNGLDAILARPDLPRERRVAAAAGLLAAAHRGLDRSRTLPSFAVHLPVDWRQRREVVAALSWRWEAASAAGLTDDLERLRFEWRPASARPATGQPAAVPSGTAKPARLVFRRESDDEVFADLFRRTLAGTLDATSRRMADVIGEYAQARSDVDFYRDRMPGDRDWWFTAHRSDGKHGPEGEPVGFGIPARNNHAPVVGYIGVLPEHRGHGYIDDILAEVTRILATEARAFIIYADTDVANKPMAAAFERAGYRNTARRLVLSAPVAPA